MKILKGKSKSIEISLFFFIFSVGCVVTFIFLDFLFFTYNTKSKLLDTASKVAIQKEQQFIDSISSSKQILLSINNSEIFKTYIKNNDLNNRSLEDIFLMFARQDKNVMQLRYINKFGYESIRIDRSTLNSEAFIVDKNKLQNKSDRYYFKDSISKNQKVWYSNLDLNMEYGKIEKPIKPTLRAILPIRENSTFDGVLIVNYYMKEILDKIAVSPSYDMIMFNKEGYPLIHYDIKKNWGYFQEKKINIKPELSNYYDEIVTSKDIFKNSDFIVKRINSELPQDLFIYFKLNDKYIETLLKDRYLHYFSVSFIILILSLIVSTFFSNYLRKVFLVLKDSKTLNKLLNEKVEEQTKLLNDNYEKIKELNETLSIQVKEEVEKNKQKDLQLFSQSKLAAMGDMIANIAHQWRQPLSTISTIASGVKIKHELDVNNKDEIMNDMDSIVRKTLYLSKTIDTFMSFVKDEKEFQCKSIKEILEDTIHIVESSLHNHFISLKTNFHLFDDFHINTVSAELQEVLINIFNNSKDILHENNVPSRNIYVNVLKENSKVLIEVEDNGGGISEDIIDRVFEPYFTTKHASQGTGLGLHMSYRIVTESLNGNIFAKNGTDGAIFTIELPLD